MRSISKPSLPPDVHADGHEPASLGEAEETFIAGLLEAPDQALFARSRFDELDKQKLRVEMYREQRSLCIYCEREVAEGYPAPRIDHWYPLSERPQLGFDWNNLYLSCTSVETCDAAKGKQSLPVARHGCALAGPLPYEDVIGFTSRGKAYVRSDVALPEGTRQALERGLFAGQDGYQVRRQSVNLNHPALVSARAAAFDGERERMENGTASETECEERATMLLEQDVRPPFVSIRVAWLRKTLGCGEQS